MLNLILSGLNGYFEGRTMADVHSLKQMKSVQMQMEFDALDDTAKQRVLEGIQRRNQDALEAKMKRGRQNLRTAILIVIGVGVWWLVGGH